LIVAENDTDVGIDLSPDRGNPRDRGLASGVTPRARFEGGTLREVFFAPHLDEFFKRVGLAFEPMLSSAIRRDTKHPLLGSCA
jgi:hypothetical protein